MPRRQPASQSRGQLPAKVVVERDARGEHDEEHQAATGSTLYDIDMDDERIEHGGVILYHRVELSRTHANTATVQSGVGAAGDDAGPAIGELDPEPP